MLCYAMLCYAMLCYAMLCADVLLSLVHGPGRGGVYRIIASPHRQHGMSPAWSWPFLGTRRLHLPLPSEAKRLSGTVEARTFVVQPEARGLHQVKQDLVEEHHKVVQPHVGVGCLPAHHPCMQLAD